MKATYNAAAITESFYLLFYLPTLNSRQGKNGYVSQRIFILDILGCRRSQNLYTYTYKVIRIPLPLFVTPRDWYSKQENYHHVYNYET